jgi:hypothetical protein
MHSLRYSFTALDSDQQRMEKALHPDRTPVFDRRSRQTSDGRGDAEAAPAVIRPGEGEAAQVSARDLRRSSAEEPGGKSAALCGESVGRVVAIFWKAAIWRSTTAPRSEPTVISPSAAAIGASRLRQWRRDRRRVAELYCHMQAERGGAVRLVPRCALTHCHASRAPPG